MDVVRQAVLLEEVHGPVNGGYVEVIVDQLRSAFGKGGDIDMFSAGRHECLANCTPRPGDPNPG